MLSEGHHEILIQYSREVEGEKVEQLRELLGKCFPNSLVSTYRHSATSPKIQLAASATKQGHRKEVASL